jgi:hypothetical protein
MSRLFLQTLWLLQATSRRTKKNKCARSQEKEKKKDKQSRSATKDSSLWTKPFPFLQQRQSRPHITRPLNLCSNLSLSLHRPQFLNLIFFSPPKKMQQKYKYFITGYVQSPHPQLGYKCEITFNNIHSPHSHN